MESKAKKASVVVMARTGLLLTLVLMIAFGFFADITLADSGLSDLSTKRTELTTLQSKIEQIKQTLSQKSRQEKDALRAPSTDRRRTPCDRIQD